RLLAARRAGGQGFDPLADRRPSGRTAGPLALAGLAPFGLILEVLVGEELLLSGRPDELCAAIHAPENPVLELHRSPPRRVRSVTRVAYSSSRRSFLRLRFRARACFARRLSPGF